MSSSRLGEKLPPLDLPKCRVMVSEYNRAIRPLPGEVPMAHWVGTWTAAPAPAEGAAFSNHTLRMIPRVSLGGGSLRVRISNAGGTRPLAIGAAAVGLRASGPALVPGSNRRLTFGGEPRATIAAGALIVSDPVELAVAPLSDLAASVHLPEDLPASFGVTGRY